MTWHSAQEATSTRDCAVPGCTGIAYSRSSPLCKWHQQNGTPDDIRSRRAAPPSEERMLKLQARLDELDERIGRLVSERRRVDSRLRRLRGEPV